MELIRLTIVQFGDFAEAAKRFANGGEESYFAQRYTVDFVLGLPARPGIGSVTVICVSRDHGTERHGDVTTVGIEVYPPGGRPQMGALIDRVAASNPTHLVISTPLQPLIRWAIGRKIATLPLFADSFRARGLKNWIRSFRLARLLNDPRISFVANHNLAASWDLVRIGVAPRKILPYDWPALIFAEDNTAKQPPASGRPLHLLYVGQVIEAKGVGDAIRALPILDAQGVAANLTIIGSGATAAFADLAASLSLDADRVVLRGKQPHGAVLEAMRSHDAVLVPSHHAYPEGLPMTLYESLCSRTPLIVSNHPMFALRFRDGDTALIHRERDPASLAAQIVRLARDPALYAALSERSAAAAKAFLCPLKWDKLISAFLSPDMQAEVAPFTLDRSGHPL